MLHSTSAAKCKELIESTPTVEQVGLWGDSAAGTTRHERRATVRPAAVFQLLCSPHAAQVLSGGIAQYDALFIPGGHGICFVSAASGLLGAGVWLRFGACLHARPQRA